MTVIHTNIPSLALPTELTDPNILTTEYESFTLIPRLGPLAYSYYRNYAQKMLFSVFKVLTLIESSQEYYKRWDAIPLIPLEVITIPRVMIAAKPELAIHFGDVLDAQPRVWELTPRERLERLRRFQPATLEPVGSVSSARKPDPKDEGRVESLKSILTAAAVPNTVLTRLAEKGHVLTEDGVVSKKLMEMPPLDQIKLIAGELEDENIDTSKFHRELAKNLLTDTLDQNHDKFGWLGRQIKGSEELSNQFKLIIAQFIAVDSILAVLSNLDQAIITASREWAFLRKERLELLLGQPQFRGPLSINSISPKSELAISRSSSSSAEYVSYSLMQSSSKLEESMVISKRIKENMGALFDYGSNLGQTMSEDGYSSDNAFGEKRTIVEASLLELSQANLVQSVSSRSTIETQLREYTTEGKDDKFATSEVSFEVFSPVHATHYLDDISAVWCPRIKNPYHHLKTAIKDYADRVEAEYIEENYVVDPAEPIPSYEGIERVSVNTKKIIDDDIDDDTTYTDVVTIELSEAESAQDYFLASDVQCVLKQDDSFWTNALDSDQYEILDPVVLEHVENSHIKIRTTLKVIEEPNGSNPDSIWLEVSVTRYKYTQAYLQKLKEYTQTVEVLNPARRNAVKVQAKKYARLKKEELIKKYESSISDLKDYAFVSLMKKIFGQYIGNGQWSYYQGIIKSCIDWERAHIAPEPASAENLSAEGLSPYHFLNVNAVRFFLPIYQNSESAFFDAVSNSVDAAWRDLFNRVHEYIVSQRDKVKELRESANEEDRKKLILDEYDSELILGRHLEAVLSKHEFST